MIDFQKIRETLEEFGLDYLYDDIIELINYLKDYYQSFDKNYKFNTLNINDNNYVFILFSNGSDGLSTSLSLNNGNIIQYLIPDYKINSKLIDKIYKILEKSIAITKIYQEEIGEEYKYNIILSTSSENKNKHIISSNDFYLLFYKLFKKINNLKLDEFNIKLGSNGYIIDYEKKDNRNTLNFKIKDELENLDDIKNIDNERINFTKKFIETCNKLNPTYFIFEDDNNIISREYSYGNEKYDISINNNLYNIFNELINKLKEEIKNKLDKHYHSLIDKLDSSFIFSFDYLTDKSYDVLWLAKKDEEGFLIYTIERAVYKDFENKEYNGAYIVIHNPSKVDFQELKELLKYNYKSTQDNEIYIKYDDINITNYLLNIHEIFGKQKETKFKFFLEVPHDPPINFLTYYSMDKSIENEFKNYYDHGLVINYDKIDKLNWIEIYNYLKNNDFDLTRFGIKIDFVFDKSLEFTFTSDNDIDIKYINFKLNEKISNFEYIIFLKSDLIRFPNFSKKVVESINIC